MFTEDLFKIVKLSKYSITGDWKNKLSIVRWKMKL